MNNNQSYSFRKLDWDTSNLGIDTYEMIFKQDIDLTDSGFLDLFTNSKGLIYIKNKTEFRRNSKIISEKTKAVLYDTNVTFGFIIKEHCSFNFENYNLEITSKLYLNENDFNDFAYSRFYKDSELKNKMKKDIYSEWISNSCEKNNKIFFTISNHNALLGYLLIRVEENNYIIELISISRKYRNMNLGSLLLNFLKDTAHKNKITKIYVGTQISNIFAINFYIKNGFYVEKTTDIYHLWL